MNVRKVIQSLENYRAGQALPDIRLPEAITEALCKHPRATINYIKERLEHQFNDRDEIGDHFRAFMKLTGLTVSQVNTLNATLNLKTLPTKSLENRKRSAQENKENRLNILEATCDVIMGMGSVPEIAETYGLTPRMIYAELRKIGKIEGFTAFSLRKWSIPERKALARKVERWRRKEIEELYAPYIA